MEITMMKKLSRSEPETEQSRFFEQHSRIVFAILVTIIFVGCSAIVLQERAKEEATVASGTETNPAEIEEIVDVLLPPQPNTSQDQNQTAGSTIVTQDQPVAIRVPPPTRRSDVLTEAEFRAQGQSLFDQGLVRVEQDSVSQSREYSQRTLQVQSGSSPVYITGPVTNRENYLDVDENTVNLVAQNPVSTFSIDVDTAAYSNIRRMIMNEGRLPPFDAVRLEEMINYFNYDYAIPENLDNPLSINTELAASPWNPANKLLMVGIQGYVPEKESRPDANLVFLVDVSGSMNSPNKLGLVQRSLKLLVDQMRETDQIALVVYAGAAGMVLDSTAGDQKHKITNAIDSLRAGGSTNGAAGIQLAYQIAEHNKIEGGINRVLIASDGDLNVGVTNIDDLKELISKKRKNGIALTTLGYGTGNYNYSLMEQLADVGDGNAAYIDSLNEARKVLVEEMQSTLLTIAKDVKIQIEFNPSVVKEYRLLGYENRLLERQDFTNDKVDAGEIGAGHTVTALYEVTLVDSTGGLIPESRYGRQTVESTVDLSGELAYIKVRNKQPDADISTETGMPVMLNDESEESNTSTNLRFASAVAGFGQLLRGGKYTGDWSYDDLLTLARSAKGTDDNGYRAEMVNLVEMAKLL
jgi:Ca-activated chloride channel family protein